MTKPLLLDLFCGAGGAGAGYARAGFEIIGVDNRPQPHYPFPFIEADALEFITTGYKGVPVVDVFAAIHASPPCQTFTRAKHLMKAQGGKTKKLDLLEPTRKALIDTGLPYIIENVPGAPLLDPAVLCGSMFGLKVRRHRLFESNVDLYPPGACQHTRQGKPIGVYHRMGDTAQGRNRKTGEWVIGGSTAKNLKEAQQAMGIDWMTWNELKESIPPDYTEHLGRVVMDDDYTDDLRHMQGLPPLDGSAE